MRASSFWPTRPAPPPRGQVRRLVAQVAALGRPLGAHFHNTRNTGFANAWTALEAGASVLDALIEVPAWLEQALGRQLPGQVYPAGGFPSPTTPAPASSRISPSE
jgi:hypothetical protein